MWNDTIGDEDVDHVQGQKPGSQRWKSNRPRWIRRHRAPPHRNNRDVVRVSTREYRHLGGLNRFWGMVRGKQAKYLERLKYFWRHIDFLLQFCADRPFLKWKFFRKRMARVTVDEIAKRIVPAVCKKTCVAYGD
ncbi:hypothetical protein PC120_g199 [Phytophthora cactorum]|nr:hypothetical protein PC120_g199 [Phytophthora cactorum]